MKLYSFCRKSLSIDNYELFSSSLYKLYQSSVLPLEKRFNFNFFHAPVLEEIDFKVRPMVMFVGQYSTGKTSLIKYLLNGDYPGISIGPEPTTDKFIYVTHGNTDKIIMGNTLVIDSNRQFRSLAQFGNSFLSKLQCSEGKKEVLKNLSLVDTPGILSGEKQRVNRGYDFVGVLKWFAERSDRIILLFDAHKLDISDEFKLCIEALRSYEEKTKVILNKADTIDEKSLMRVYGALLWSLGKIFNTPEVVRIYVGSFWNKPLRCNAFQKLLESEQKDLMGDLLNLSQTSALRKLNDFNKRVRLVKAHAQIIDKLNSKMPYVFGKTAKREDLIKTLEDIFLELQTKGDVSSGDLPSCQEMQSKLEKYDFSKLASLKKGMISDIDEMIDKDVSKLMELISDETIQIKPVVPRVTFESSKVEKENPASDDYSEKSNAGLGEEDRIVNKFQAKNVFDEVKDRKYTDNVASEFISKSKLSRSVPRDTFGFSKGEAGNPFSDSYDKEINAGLAEWDWIANKYRAKYNYIFDKIRDGKVPNSIATGLMSESKLPKSDLYQIWKLSDVDNDGSLDWDEFVLAMYLVDIKLRGYDLPYNLPQHVIPTSKRR